MRSLQLRQQVSEFKPNGGEAVRFFKGNLEAPDFSRVRIHLESEKEYFQVNTQKINVSIARGISIYQNSEEFSEIFKKADAEMYKHKAAIKAKKNQS